MRAHRTSLIASLALLLWPAPTLTVARASGDDPTKFAAPTVDAGPRVRTLFDFDWRFHAGDVSNAQLGGLDDASWERVDLPHDFMIEGKGDRATAAAIWPLATTRGGASRATFVDNDRRALAAWAFARDSPVRRIAPRRRMLPGEKGQRATDC